MEFGLGLESSLSFDISNVRSALSTQLALLNYPYPGAALTILPSTEFQYGTSVEQRAEFDAAWQFKEGYFTITSDNTSYSNLTATHTLSSTTFALDHASMSRLAGVDLNIAKLALSGSGNAALLGVGNSQLLSDFANTAASVVSFSEGLQASQVGYEKSKAVERVSDAKLGIDLAAALGLGFEVSADGQLTVTQSRRFVIERGTLHNGVFELESYTDDALVQGDERDFGQVMNNMLSGVIPLIADALRNAIAAFRELVDSASRTIVKTASDIAAGGAQLVAEAGTIASGAYLELVEFSPHFTSLTPDGQSLLRPYKASVVGALALQGMRAEGLALGAVTAVGNAYQVHLTDTDGQPNSEFESPIGLQIVISDEDLLQAGFSSSDRTSLAVFKWDEDSSFSTPIPSVTAGDTVQAQVSKAGQYFAGIAGYPLDLLPPIIDSTSIQNGEVVAPLRSLAAWVTDTTSNASGLDASSAFAVVDGDTQDVFMEMPNLYHATMWVAPVPDSEWTLGDHSVTISVGDHAGHQLEFEINFTVACNCPVQGDADGDGFVNAVDLQFAIDAVFFGGSNPQEALCPRFRLDVDDSGAVDATDIQYLIDYIFFGGAEPVDPCTQLR